MNDVASAKDSSKTTEEKARKNVDINTVHGLFHLGEKLLRLTYKNLNVKLTDTLLPCDGCCRANAKAKGVHKSMIPLQRRLEKDFS